MSAKNGQVKDKVEDVTLLFDLSGLTGRDWQRYREGIAEQRKILARVVTSGPESWGDLSDPMTYYHMRFKDLLRVKEAFGQALKDAKPKSITGLAFDVDNLTVAEMENFNPEDVLTFLVCFTTEVPVAWGQKDDVETYLNLPLPTFIAAQDALTEAIKDLAKN